MQRSRTLQEEQLVMIGIAGLILESYPYVKDMPKRLGGVSSVIAALFLENWAGRGLVIRNAAGLLSSL
jgi:hypothetical protein